jgi:hypothetical protein
MIDDSRTPSPSSANLDDAGLPARISEISRCRITRYSAYTWAQNLRFLAYDDSSDTDEEKASAVQDPTEVNSIKEPQGSLGSPLRNDSSSGKGTHVENSGYQ